MLIVRSVVKNEAEIVPIYLSHFLSTNNIFSSDTDANSYSKHYICKRDTEKFLNTNENYSNLNKHICNLVCSDFSIEINERNTDYCQQSQQQTIS